MGETGATMCLLDADVFWVGFATMASGWFRGRCPLGIIRYGILVTVHCDKSLEWGLSTNGPVMLSFLDCCERFSVQWMPEGCTGAKMTGALKGSTGVGVTWGAGGLAKIMFGSFRADCLGAGVFCTDESMKAGASF